MIRQQLTSFRALGWRGFRKDEPFCLVGTRKMSGSPRLTLNKIKDNRGANKVAKRVGRGIGSGKGKTAGRGHKGQKSRQGNKGMRGRGFEGGQTPLHLKIPKTGFPNTRFKAELKALNVEKLQKFVDKGRLDPSKPITMKELFDANIVGKIPHGVKLLGRGHITTPVNIEVTRASKSAIEAIEAAGGTVVCGWYNRLNLRALLKPHKFDVIPRRARPPPRKMKYYQNYENRGYLSPEMQLKFLEQQREGSSEDS